MNWWQQTNLVVSTEASLLALIGAAFAAYRWRTMISAVAGKYKHEHVDPQGQPYTSDEMSFTLERPGFWLPFRMGGKFISGKGTEGTWKTNLWGTSLTLIWGDAEIRATRKADGVYEGYHISGDKITRETRFRKVRESGAEARASAAPDASPREAVKP